MSSLGSQYPTNNVANEAQAQHQATTRQEMEITTGHQRIQHEARSLLRSNVCTHGFLVLSTLPLDNAATAHDADRLQLCLSADEID